MTCLVSRRPITFKLTETEVYNEFRLRFELTRTNETTRFKQNRAILKFTALVIFLDNGHL